MGDIHLEPLGHPAAHGVVPTGKPPGVVRVQALHATACAAHSPAGARPLPPGRDGRVTLSRIASMSPLELDWVYRGFGCPHPAVGFQAVHEEARFFADEPVPSRHRRPVVQQWGVADHNGHVLFVTHDHFVGAARLAPKERSDLFARLRVFFRGDSRILRVSTRERL